MVRGRGWAARSEFDDFFIATLIIISFRRPPTPPATNRSFVLSADGKRLAYAAKKNGKWFVVVDGQPGPEFDSILRRVFASALMDEDSDTQPRRGVKALWSWMVC